MDAVLLGGERHRGAVLAGRGEGVQLIALLRSDGEGDGGPLGGLLGVGGHLAVVRGADRDGIGGGGDGDRRPLGVEGIGLVRAHGEGDGAAGDGHIAAIVPAGKGVTVLGGVTGLDKGELAAGLGEHLGEPDLPIHQIGYPVVVRPGGLGGGDLSGDGAVVHNVALAGQLVVGGEGDALLHRQGGPGGEDGGDVQGGAAHHPQGVAGGHGGHGGVQILIDGLGGLVVALAQLGHVVGIIRIALQVGTLALDGLQVGVAHVDGDGPGPIGLLGPQLHGLFHLVLCAGEGKAAAVVHVDGPPHVAGGGQAVGGDRAVVHHHAGGAAVADGHILQGQGDRVPGAGGPDVDAVLGAGAALDGEVPDGDLGALLDGDHMGLGVAGAVQLKPVGGDGVARSVQHDIGGDGDGGLVLALAGAGHHLVPEQLDGLAVLGGLHGGRQGGVFHLGGLVHRGVAGGAGLRALGQGGGDQQGCHQAQGEDGCE